MLTTVKPRLIRTPHYYRQFAFPWGKKAFVASLNSTPLIRTLSIAPLVSPCLNLNFHLPRLDGKIFLGQPPNLNHAILTFY